MIASNSPSQWLLPSSPLSFASFTLLFPISSPHSFLALLFLILGVCWAVFGLAQHETDLTFCSFVFKLVSFFSASLLTVEL